MAETKSKTKWIAGAIKKPGSLRKTLGIKKLNLLEHKNIAWREDKKIKIADFEWLKLPELSPYILGKNLIIDI